MRDLKHIHLFEELLERTDNRLVRQEKESGGVAVGYSCYYVPEALLNCGRAFSVRLRAPNTGSLDISQYYMSSFICGYTRALFERAFEGGSELMLDDLWEKTAAYNADMILMFDQISCKGVGAINGLFEEGARKRGIPMCRVRQDLMDPTSITRREMRGDVNVFMQTVMNETPLDPSLVDFDDDESW